MKSEWLLFHLPKSPTKDRIISNVQGHIDHALQHAVLLLVRRFQYKFIHV